MREGALPEAIEHRLDEADSLAELPLIPAPTRRVPYVEAKRRLLARETRKLPSRSP